MLCLHLFCTYSNNEIVASEMQKKMKIRKSNQDGEFLFSPSNLLKKNDKRMWLDFHVFKLTETELPTRMSILFKSYSNLVSIKNNFIKNLKTNFTITVDSVLNLSWLPYRYLKNHKYLPCFIEVLRSKLRTNRIVNKFIIVM